MDDEHQEREYSRWLESQYEAAMQAEYEGWLADRRAELRADDDGMRSFSADKENGK